MCWLGPILPAASLGPLPRASSFSHSVQICTDPTALNDIPVLNGLGHHSSSVGTHRDARKGLKRRAGDLEGCKWIKGDGIGRVRTLYSYPLFMELKCSLQVYVPEHLVPG